ncbi:ABC transporter permease subunit [Staphylococcus condimenti]|uniref:ABC transporter permease subunit n=1 Tax=Staphylococcus condimenti TaxID=70255 RepID=A0A4Q7CKG6_9STAP|nr:nickel/cobalt ABC transporter permease [Staphylococcus condimenti]RZI00891.1 ABC transporter permease subunit [Staphylococcus condimenti]RZI01662.1 ABC transporter permease subunit [Staphylococcus condimenti]
MSLIKRLLKDKAAFCALIVITAYIILGVFAETLTPYHPNAVDLERKFEGASLAHWLGTDHLGRDILTRLIFAIRPSFLLVFLALFCSVALGTIIGIVSGYFGKWVDAVAMRICDVMLSFPSYVMTLALVGMLGVGLKSIIVAFILTRWAWFCRVIRTSVMQYRHSDAIKYARTIGISHFKIMRTHIFPLIAADIAIVSSSSMVSMILQISGFSFLGLGVKAPTAEWGMMMNEARSVMFSHPKLMIIPGIAIAIIALSFNFLADALQLAVNPDLMRKRKSIKLKKGVAKE